MYIKTYLTLYTLLIKIKDLKIKIPNPMVCFPVGGTSGASLFECGHPNDADYG